jgi:hypothetical protein
MPLFDLGEKKVDRKEAMLREGSMSTGEAAQYLGVSIKQLHRWHADKTLIPDWVLPRGHRRYDIDSLRRFKDSCKPH